VQVVGWLLALTVGVYPNLDPNYGRAGYWSPRAVAPLPDSAAVPESVPTTRAKLPARPAGPARDWILSLEAVTHAPVDVGVRAGVDMPFRLRASFGYGWVPAVYSNLLTGIAASASGDAEVAAILNNTSYQGRTVRGQVGVRPFRSLGLYADFGLARLDIHGSLDLAESGVPALRGLGGGYQARTTIDMWLVEVGSQHELWDSVLMGLAFGVMGTFDAQTSISVQNGAPTSPVLVEAARQTDSALKTYGFVPTLTLRLGFDFFSLRPLLSSPSPGG